jgi:hypothetical protein
MVHIWPLDAIQKISSVCALARWGDAQTNIVRTIELQAMLLNFVAIECFMVQNQPFFAVFSAPRVMRARTLNTKSREVNALGAAIFCSLVWGGPATFDMQ